MFSIHTATQVPVTHVAGFGPFQWVEVGRDLGYLCYFSASQAESSPFWGVVTGRHLCLSVVQLCQE